MSVYRRRHHIQYQNRKHHVQGYKKNTSNNIAIQKRTPVSKLTSREIRGNVYPIAKKLSDVESEDEKNNESIAVMKVSHPVANRKLYYRDDGYDAAHDDEDNSTHQPTQQVQGI